MNLAQSVEVIVQKTSSSENLVINKELLAGLVKKLEIDDFDSYDFLTSSKQIDTEDLLDLVGSLGIELEETTIFDRVDDQFGNWADVEYVGFDATDYSNGKVHRICRESSLKETALDYALQYVCEKYSLGHLLSIITSNREAN